MSNLLTLTVNSGNVVSKRSNADFKVDFFDPVVLGPSTDKYEVGLVNFSYWFTWNNISQAFGNNVLRYSPNAGATWYSCTFPDGLYSVSAISDQLHEFMKANGHYVLTGTDYTYFINIIASVTTGRVKVEIMDVNYRLDFTNSLMYNLLGFASEIVSATKFGQNDANITNGIDTVNLHCSIAETSYNGQNSDIIASASVYTSIGGQNVYQPGYILYNKISTHILKSISFRITDQYDRLIDFPDPDTVNLQLAFRKVQI